MSRVLSARLELAAIAATSRLSRHRVFTPTIAFDPPGLGSTTCDRITSSTECHIEKHAEPHEKERNASKIGECVLDDSEEECSDGCCCFTKGTKEECRGYQLDNYTLTALVESGNEEYQHFQNATGHWVRRLGRKVCPALVGVLVAILGQRRRPRRVDATTLWKPGKSLPILFPLPLTLHMQESREAGETRLEDDGSAALAPTCGFSDRLRARASTHTQELSL